MDNNNATVQVPVNQYVINVCPHCGALYGTCQSHICPNPGSYAYIRQSAEHSAVLAALEALRIEIESMKKTLEKLHAA